MSVKADVNQLDVILEAIRYIHSLRKQLKMQENQEETLERRPAQQRDKGDLPGRVEKLARRPLQPRSEDNLPSREENLPRLDPLNCQAFRQC